MQIFQHKQNGSLLGDGKEKCAKQGDNAGLLKRDMWGRFDNVLGVGNPWRITTL